MFTWICPQCGGEVLPSQDECPRCVKAAAAAPAAPVQAPAPAPVQAAAPPAAPAPVPVYPPQAPTYAPPAPGYEAPPEHRSTMLRDLLVTAGVAVALLGVGYLFWTRNDRGEQAAVKHKTELESVKGEKAAHPLAKQIELAGVRILVPKTGQAEVRLVVVNHSAAEFSNLAMDVVLSAKGTTKEVAVFPVTVKRLSALGSAEVSVKTKMEVSALDLPDWQFLEAKAVIQAAER